MSKEQFSNIIHKVNAKDKVADFRDCLVPPVDNDYAMVHGVGGKDHAPVSCIKCVICDYSKGTGDASVTVSANIKPHIVELLREAAKGFLLNPATIPTAPTANVSSNDNGDTITISSSDANNITQAFALVKSKASKDGGKVEGDDFVALGKALRAAYNACKDAATASPAATAPAPVVNTNADFSYTQERVNPYKIGKDGLAEGYAPVTYITFSHQSMYYNKENVLTLSNYPWTIKITTGSGKAVTSDIGATSIQRGTFQKKNEAFIKISNLDMFECMDSVQRFINAWEMAVSVKIVRNGLEIKRAQREEWFAKQAGENAQQ